MKTLIVIAELPLSSVISVHAGKFLVANTANSGAKSLRFVSQLKQLKIKVFFLVLVALSVCSPLLLGQNFVWTQSSAPGLDWRLIASSSDGTKLFATVGGSFGSIYASTNSGLTWTQTSAPNQNWLSIASSADGTKLAAVVLGGGIFTSTNSGLTWSQTSAPMQDWISIASSSDGTKLAAAVDAISGDIYTSTNSGVTWTQAGESKYSWQSLASSSDGTKLAAVSYGGGIYTAYIPTRKPSSLALQIFSGYPLLSLYGTLSNTYAIEYSTNLSESNWTPLLVVPNLSLNPFQLIDPGGVGQPMRFYRAVQQ